MEAIVLNIQRLSTEDGPGLRTTVFFKGCSLDCSWCQNPESIDMRQEIEWLEARCIGCEICIDGCPNQAVESHSDGIHINREKCISCYNCATNCPTLALELKGEVMTLDHVYQELLKDRAYYEGLEGGGVTLSGGEVLLQYDYATALLKRLKEAGIGTAIDTCGLCSKASIEQVFPYTDLFLYDLKVINNERHEKYTGQANERILDNLQYLSKKVMGDSKKRLWIRTPIIPGYTDDLENIRGLTKFIVSKLSSSVEKWELCAFNNLCRDKYHRLGKEWIHENTPLVTKSHMENLVTAIKEMGFIDVSWSGLTRYSKEERRN